MTIETQLCGTLVKNQTQAVANTLKSGGAGNVPSSRGENLVACGIDGGETAFALRAGASHSGDKGDGGMNTTTVVQEMAVRRLTPLECERLQGFPDGWTRIPRKTYKQKKVTKTRPVDLWSENPDGSWTLHAADGPRYKALGNSMAVPVMEWIGARIATVNEIST